MNLKNFFVLLFVLLCAPAWAANNYAEGEALVVFEAPEGVKASSLSVAEAVAEMHASIAESYDTLSEIEGKIIVLVRSDTLTTEELIAELEKRPDVISATPNYKMRAPSNPTEKKTSITTTITAAAVTANDPSADLCWGLNAINAPDVWEDTTGSQNVYAAVIDTGAYKHEDLQKNIAESFGRSIDDEDWSQDLNGHGTHVAGTIGAVGNNKIGVAGVNWTVSIIPIKIFSESGASDNNTFASNLMNAVNYITTTLQNNPSMKIAAVNMSLGIYINASPEELQNTALWLAFHALDATNRTLIFVAASNEGIEVGKPTLFDAPPDSRNNREFLKGAYIYPASFTGLNNFVVVGALDSSYKAASFTCWGEKVDISAPGVEILSTYSPLAPEDDDESNTPAGVMYKYLEGTSMATPHAVGAAALLASKFPNATPAQIKYALLNGANKNRNPLVYPYEYQIAEFRQKIAEEVDELIAKGQILPTTRETVIERMLAEYITAYAPYEILDGKGTVSRMGFLDVKAAYDILAAQQNNNATVGSSGGGCNAGFGFVIILAGAAALIRKFQALS